MPNIRDILIESNPWWKAPTTIDYKERDLYTHLKKFLTLPQIISITGMRRVGKTTLMLKILQDSIKRGYNPHNLLYFSFDEFRDINIRELLKEYERILNKNLKHEKYLILFDEIQKLENWENQIKRLYDTYKNNIKIIISGSESLFIKKKSRATLAGRLFEFILTPLNFKEYLQFIDVYYEKKGLYEKELEAHLANYKLTQGFPELVNINDKDIIKKYIKESIVEKVIYRDIPGLLKIRDISVLESILTIFMEEPGQIIELSELASDLHITRQTLSMYLRYLESSFLIKKLYNFSKNKRKTERKLKKYYPTIVSVDLLFKNESTSQSKILEWFIVNQLNAEYFWRDSYKNEVDIIQTKDNKIIPIEVKYGKIETKSLLKFMDIYNLNKGYIITSTMDSLYEYDKKRIQAIPVHKFLINNYLL
jgi:predicted AAA+ superfamily ATPase